MLFVPGGIAVATKKSRTTTGSFLVVKSTRLSATTQAELGTVQVFSPAQKSEANEYASIIARADASGQPAPPVDALLYLMIFAISSPAYFALTRARISLGTPCGACIGMGWSREPE